jgi:hypothetical protein
MSKLTSKPGCYKGLASGRDGKLKGRPMPQPSRMEAIRRADPPSMGK